MAASETNVAFQPAENLMKMASLTAYRNICYHGGLANDLAPVIKRQHENNVHARWQQRQSTGVVIVSGARKTYVRCVSVAAAALMPAGATMWLKAASAGRRNVRRQSCKRSAPALPLSPRSVGGAIFALSYQQSNGSSTLALQRACWQLQPRAAAALINALPAARWHQRRIFNNICYYPPKVFPQPTCLRCNRRQKQANGYVAPPLAASGCAIDSINVTAGTALTWRRSASLHNSDKAAPRRGRRRNEAANGCTGGCGEGKSAALFARRRNQSASISSGGMEGRVGIRRHRSPAAGYAAHLITR
jgi:hypothetical protein